VRITWIITFVCAAALVSAQQPVAKGFSSAADVQGMIEKAKNERKSDQPISFSRFYKRLPTA